MGAGYQVILTDLQAAASTFGREAGRLRTLQPRIQPPSVPSGDAALDATLRALLETFGVYGTSLSESVGEHGGKLQQCHDGYHRNEADVVELYNTVMGELGG